MDTSNSEQAGNLNGKWWYRLLRVILLPLYAVVLLVVLSLIYDDKHPRNGSLDVQRSVIVCDDGKTYPLAATGDYFAADASRDQGGGPLAVVSQAPVIIPGEQLTGDPAEKARCLCCYGQTETPSKGLATVKMPDGTYINGVPLALAGTPPGPHLVARYRRWQNSQAAHPAEPTLPQQTFTDVQPAPSLDLRAGLVPVLQFQALHAYTVKLAFKTEGSWAEALLYMAIAWLVIHLATVMVRGAVVYVATGQFLPVAGLRGWLTL